MYNTHPTSDQILKPKAVHINPDIVVLLLLLFECVLCKSVDAV